MRKKITRLNVLLISICALMWAGCLSSTQERSNELSSNSDSTPVELANQGLEFFQGSYKEALAQAEKEDKYVFLFVDTPGSFNCDVMRETVFPLPEVGEYFNKRFISFHLDLSAEASAPYSNNEPVETDTVEDDEFVIVEYPAYMILDSSGDELGLVQGRLSSIQLISVVDRVIGESESTFENLQERYDSGDRSPQFVQQYLMEAIEEFAVVSRDSDYRASKSTFRDNFSKYKELADAYFASKPSTELINETDAHLIMYFYEPPVRGDELVEFVLRNYDEFVAVSSEMVMAEFTLRATIKAVQATALSGDEKFVEYVEALETYPLKKAVDYERTRKSRSQYFPEFIKSHWGVDYHMARGEWDQVNKILQAVSDAQEREQVYSQYWNYSMVAAMFLQSDNSDHLTSAVELGKSLYESNDQDPSYTAIYVAALQASGKKYSAMQVAAQYRKRMTRFGYHTQLNSYEETLSSLLDPINETETSEE